MSNYKILDEGILHARKAVSRVLPRLVDIIWRIRSEIDRKRNHDEKQHAPCERLDRKRPEVLHTRFIRVIIPRVYLHIVQIPRNQRAEQQHPPTPPTPRGIWRVIR